MGTRKPFVRVALLLALLAAVVDGLAAWYFMPISYKVQARLHVAAMPPKVLFQTVETTPGGDDYKRFQSTQQALVKSQLVLGAALRDPRASKCRMIREQLDPVEWLAEKLKVEFISGSELMEISMSGSDPDEMANIVNAVKRAYMDEVVNVEARKRTSRHEHLKKLREMYTELLKKKRDVMRKLAETVGSDDRQTLALRQQWAMEQSHDLRTQLFKLRLERSEVEILLARRKEARKAATDPERKEIAELEDRLAVNIAGQKMLEEDLKGLTSANQRLTTNTLDLAGNQEEIALMTDTARKIGTEVEALNVELDAPPRIRLIDDATVPKSGNEKERAMMFGMISLGSFFVVLLGVAILMLVGRKGDSADEGPIEPPSESPRG